MRANPRDGRAQFCRLTALVSELYPVEKRDISILKAVGLLTAKTVLAHCCHLRDSEVAEMVAAGAAITSCPYVCGGGEGPSRWCRRAEHARYSNILFARATVPIPRFKALGLKISLGTDIAGGTCPLPSPAGCVFF